MSNSRVNLKAFLPIFLIIAVWDAFTTVFGTIAILGGANFGTIVMGVMVAVLMLILFVSTFRIWDNPNIDSEFIGILLKGLWLLAFCYDLYTSYYGNREFIISSNSSGSAITVVILATILVSGSTIVAAWILEDS